MIDALEHIFPQDITYELAIESGFQGRAELLKVAKHGSGENFYLPLRIPGYKLRERFRR